MVDCLLIALSTLILQKIKQETLCKFYGTFKFFIYQRINNADNCLLIVLKIIRLVKIKLEVIQNC